MSTTDNFKHIKNISSKAEVTAPNASWDRIEYKLKNQKATRKSRKKDFWKFWLSIAASLMVIFTCGYLIYNESNRKDVVKSEYLVQWEDLEESDDYFYSVDLARKLNRLGNAVASH